MASKMGLILSLLFIFIAFTFGVDFVMIQLTYTGLDALSQSVSYKISKVGEVTSEIKEFALKESGVKIIPVDENKIYTSGDLYPYYLAKDYRMISYEREPLTIKLKRFAVINIYK